MSKPVAIVAGIGVAGGTGFSVSKAFATEGFRVALLARRPDALDQAAKSISNSVGGEVAPFPVKQYDWENLTESFKNIKEKWPDSNVKVAVFNAGQSVFKPFLSITPEEWKTSLDINVGGGAAFAYNSIQAFLKNDVDESGNRGTLIFTSATAAWRGNVVTSSFAASKHALRGLAQSLNKEFGKQNIHVCQAIIDGQIRTEQRHANVDRNERIDELLDPDAIANEYVHLHKQHRSAWTFELDLRPSHEKW